MSHTYTWGAHVYIVGIPDFNEYLRFKKFKEHPHIQNHAQCLHYIFDIVYVSIFISLIC